MAPSLHGAVVEAGHALVDQVFAQQNPVVRVVPWHTHEVEIVPWPHAAAPGLALQVVVSQTSLQQ